MSLMPPSYARPNIIDRNGVVLAMDIPAASIFAEPRRLLDVDETVEGLTSVFPELNASELYKRLDSDRGFVWIKRQVSVAQRDRVWNLGLPAVAYREETLRLYPNGNLAAHVLGSVNTDNIGIAGMEKWIDGQGLQELREVGLSPDSSALEPVALSVDLRAQFMLTEELKKAVEKFSAIAAAGLIMDVTNGEVIALASLPDFDPNSPADALKSDRINRINVGTYEMGSTFKAMTTAMALDSGVFNLSSVLDASQPLRFGRMAIRDYRGQNRPLNVPESFIHSSNIAMGRMALAVGTQRHQAFLKSLGQFERLTTELPENAQPILPARWGEITTATAAFGHGIAVTPLQAAMGIAALVNGGDLIRPTLMKGAALDPRIIRRNCRHPSDRRGTPFPDAAERRSGICQESRRARLFHWRQDGHIGKGGERRLFQRPRAHRLHGRRTGQQAAIPLSHHPRRTQAASRNVRLPDVRLERRAGDGHDHGARPALASRLTHLGPAKRPLPSHRRPERLGFAIL